MPDPRIYQPTPLGDAPAPVPSWVQYEEEEKQRRRDEEAATRADAEKTARDLFALGFGDGSRLYPHHPGAGTGAQPSTADIQQTWSENVDPTRVAEHPEHRQDYGLDPYSISRAFDRIPIQSEETGQWESGEPQPHIPEPPFGAWDDLTTQEKMEHVFHGMGVAMEENPKFADDINLDKGKELYKDIPILGSWQDFGEDLTLMQRTQNIVDGKGTKRDFFELSKVMQNANFWEKEAHVGERAVRNIRDVGKYGIEFAMTAGAGALAKKVGSELAEAALKKTGFKELMKRGAKRTASAISGGQQGMVRAGVMGVPMAGSTFVRGRGGPGNLEATEGGGYKMREQEDSAFLDGLEAAAMAQAELLIETLPIGKMAAGVKNKFLQSFGREVAQEVAPAVRGGMKQSMAINSFLSEFGEERMIELVNTAITRDTAHLGVTGMGEGSGRDLLDETIALGAMQVPFGAGRLARRASKIGAPIPTEPPTIERTETPVPSWQQEIVPAVDTLADPLPLTQYEHSKWSSEVESKIDSLATDNLSSRRDFELVELPDGGTLLDSYPSKASREEFLEQRRAEMAPVAPVDDVPPLAELGEAEQPSALEGQVEAPELMAEEAPIEPIKPSPVIEEEAPIEAPPVIKTEAPVEDESTPEENAVAVEQIGKIDVMRIFPGRKVTEEGDGNFDVHFKGGRWRIIRRDMINLTDKQKIGIYNDYGNSSEIFRTDQSGKKYTFLEVYPTVDDFLKADLAPRGSIRTSNEAERAADATWDVLGTIEVAGGRGTDKQIKALAHEAVHAAHLSGLWTDKEWSVLVKAYSKPGSTTRQQSEDIARASQNKETAWEDPGFMDRMVDWMNRMLSKIGLKELSPQAARNMFFRSSLFNRQADTSSRVERVPSDQAPMAMAESDIDPAKPRTLRHSDAKFGDPDYMDALVFEILLDEKQYDVAGRHYDKMTKEANDKADAERKAKGLAKKRKALPYYQMTREEFEETGEVLYHGTSRLFDEFDWEKAKTRTGGSQKELSDFKSKQTGTEGNLSRFYFTDNKRVAETFAHETGGMIEVNLTEVIMYEERVYGQTQWDNEEQGGDVLTAYKAAIRKAMKAKNLDLKWMNEDGELVDAKDPDDIKDFWWWEEGVSILLYPSGNKPRVIETKVYGRTLDLRKGKKRPDNFPSKLENVLGTLSYQHEYSPMLIKWARDNGYGKIRVEDHGTSGGESIIGLQEFIGHKADPHREIVQRALNAGHDVPTEASSSYEGIQAEDGPIKFAMLDPDATDPGDPNPFPKAIEAGEKQLSIMEGILKGMGDNAKPHHKGNVTRAKNRLAQLQIETRVEEEFNRNGKTAGYKWVEDPSKYNQVSVEERESAEERVEDEITPKIPDEPIKYLDAEMDWRGKPVQDPETRIDRAVPIEEGEPYLIADRKPRDVVHHKDVVATIKKYRSGTEAERKEKDDAFIDEFLNTDKATDIHSVEYAIQLTRELQLTKKAEDFEMSQTIAQRYRDINAESARIVAYGKHVGSPLQKKLSRLEEAIFERDKMTLALIKKRKSKDPVERAAGEKAWEKELERLDYVRKVAEDMGYEWTQEGMREITKNRADQQRLVQAALYSKKGNFVRLLEINSEYTIGSMLSGLNTLYTNLVSGPANAVFLASERRSAAVANEIFNPTDITLTDYKLAKELKQLGITELDLSQIIQDSFNNGLTRLLHEYGPLEDSLGVNEVQQFEIAPAIPEISIGGKRIRAGRAVRGVLGLGPMAASDQFMKTFYTTLNVRLHAAHIARTEALTYNKRNPDKDKLTDKDIKARAVELLTDRESSAWKAAYQDALEITFQDEGGPISSAVIKKVMDLKRGDPVGDSVNAGAAIGKLAEQSMFLFVRTPIRMFSQVAVRTPGLGTGLSYIKYRNNIKNGRPALEGVPPHFISQLGVSLMVSLLFMDDEDPLEGFFGLSGSLGSLGEEQRKFGYESVPKNAVRFGDTWIKTDRLDPFDILFATLIDGVKSVQKGRGAKQLAWDVTESAFATAKEKSVLRSFKDVTEAFSGARKGGIKESGTNWMESALTRYIPGLVSQTARFLDEDIYSSQTDSMGKNILIKAGVKAGDPVINLWGDPAKREKHLVTPDTQEADIFKGSLAFQKWNVEHTDDKYQPMEFDGEYTDEDGSKVKFDGADKSIYQVKTGLLAKKLVDALVPRIHTEEPDRMTLEVINLLRSKAKSIVVTHYEKHGDFNISTRDPAILKMVDTIYRSPLVSEKSYQYDKQPTKKGGKYEDQPADMEKFNEMKAGAKRYREWLVENWSIISGKIKQ